MIIYFLFFAVLGNGPCPLSGERSGALSLFVSHFLNRFRNQNAGPEKIPLFCLNIFSKKSGKIFVVKRILFVYQCVMRRIKNKKLGKQLLFLKESFPEFIIG